MSWKKMIVAGAVVLATIMPLHAQSNQSDERIAQLEHELAAVKRQLQDNWLTERRAEEVKNLVREVLQDAETRASLLEDGMSAGHDGKNFYLKSPDGGFSMRISGQVQLRHTVNFQSDDSANTVDDFEQGFELRRTKIQFAGHIADPRLMYTIRIRVERDDNTVVGEEITLAYKLTPALTLWGGETKIPLLREELASSARLTAAERSYANEIFTTGFAQGVGLTWQDESVLDNRLRAALAVSDGARSAETGARTMRFTQPTRTTSKLFQDDAADFAVTGRVDLRLAGDWAKWGEFTSWPNEDFTAFVGAAIHHEYGETGDSVDGNNNFTVWTVDGSVHCHGWSGYGAFMMLNTDNEAGFGDYSPWGLVLQMGYNFAFGEDYLEPFIRYDRVDFDGYATDQGLTDDEVDILTFGVNYYLNKHNAKLTVDLVWAMDSIPFAVTNTGLLADPGNDDDQVVLRTQFQLLF